MLTLKELVKLIYSELQKGAEAIEEIRKQAERRSRVSMSLGKIDVEMPFSASVGESEDGILKEIEEDGRTRRAYFNISVVPGEGTGILKMSFIPVRASIPKRDQTLPVELVEGIGSVLGERLRSAGIEHIGQLAEAEPERVAEVTGVSKGRAEVFVNMAKLIKLGARPQTAEILSQLKVTPKKLPEIEIDKLIRMMEEAIEKKRVQVPEDYKISYEELASLLYHVSC